MDYQNDSLYISLLILLFFIQAILAGAIAQKKGHSFGAYFAAAMIFPTIALFIAVLISPRKKEVDPLTAYHQHKATQAAQEREARSQRLQSKRVRVAQAGQDIGMLSVSEIRARMESDELTDRDHFLDKSTNTWQPLIDLEGLYG